MNIKKIIMSVNKDDILNFISLQNNVKVNNLEINEEVVLSGQYQFLKNGIDFVASGEFSKVENNIVYMKISNFKISKLNIIGSISKKIFNGIIKAFTDIEGVNFEKEYLTIDISKLIEKYHTNDTVINLERVQANDIKIVDGEIEVIFSGIEINTSRGNKIPEFIDAEIVYDPIPEVAITATEIEEYKDEFDEVKLFDKIKSYGKTAGVSVIYAALILYYTYKDKNVPLSAKVISIGALGYFIVPTDIIPDIILMTGYTDDVVALVTAIKTITEYINDDIKLNARNRLGEWFDNIDEKDLEVINGYI